MFVTPFFGERVTRGVERGVRGSMFHVLMDFIKAAQGSACLVVREGAMYGVFDIVRGVFTVKVDVDFGL